MFLINIVYEKSARITSYKAPICPNKGQETRRKQVRKEVSTSNQFSRLLSVIEPSKLEILKQYKNCYFPGVDIQAYDKQTDRDKQNLTTK